jgi:hypothetical protein
VCGGARVTRHAARNAHASRPARSYRISRFPTSTDCDQNEMDAAHATARVLVTGLSLLGPSESRAQKAIPSIVLDGLACPQQG